MFDVGPLSDADVLSVMREFATDSPPPQQAECGSAWRQENRRGDAPRGRPVQSLRLNGPVRKLLLTPRADWIPANATRELAARKAHETDRPCMRLASERHRIELASFASSTAP